MFYDNLKAICDAKGVKITPIVNECGGAKGSISNWRKGASPNSDIVAKLSVRLNVSTDLLIFGKENQTNELTVDEQELLKNYNKLTGEEKKKVIKSVEELADGTVQKMNNKRLKSVQHINSKENEMMRLFRSLSDDEQMRLIGRAEVLAEQAKLEESVG